MRKAPALEAIWFGRDEARCFGTLRRPEVASRRGVVLCNTLGFDGLIAQRAFRHLATDLADRGFWSLRFDYDGEGDSAGGPWEPDRLTAWIKSIDAAVGVLRARGVNDIRLVGLRAGASLAHLYATTHPGITAEVLWWPAVSGSGFVRELRALSRLSAAARPVQRVTADRFPDTSVEVCGFEFSAEALEELAQIDMLAAPYEVPPPAVLLIERVDTTPNDLLLRKFVDAGAHVEHERTAGYTDFMTNNEVESEPPLATMNRIAEWLDAFEPPTTDQPQPVALKSAVVESTTLAVDDATAGRFTPAVPPRDRVIEEQVWVDNRLFGILSTPSGRSPIRPASIVLCTVGANNRIGPGRLYVNLARYWANLGFTVLRVDFGVGDSVDVDPLVRTETHAPVRVDEVAQTVAWIRRKTGFDAAVLFGLCSGAFNSFHAVKDGVAVNHAMLVNPAIFYLGADQTLSSSAEVRLSAAHALSRGLMSPRSWRLVLREQSLQRGLRRARTLLRVGAADGIKHAAGAVARNTARRMGLHVKSPSELPRDLEAITARGTKVMLMFSAGESSAHYVHMFAGPALEELLRGDHVDLVEIDGGDHVFSSPGSRQRLVEEATQYLEREYPLASRPATVTDGTLMSANDA